jgi:hypothetical protein
MVQVEARREHFARPGQNDGTVIELGFETIERGMKIGKERRVLRIDLVGIHGHDRDVVMFPFDLPRHVNTPLGFREPLVDTIAQVALSLYQINFDVRSGSQRTDIAQHERHVRKVPQADKIKH